MGSSPERLAYMREYNAKRAKDPKYRAEEKARHRRTYERHKDSPAYKARHAEDQRRYRKTPNFGKAMRPDGKRTVLLSVET